MACELKSVEYSVDTTNIVRTAPTLDTSSAPTGMVLLPHSGTNKVYKEAIDVFGQDTITLHFYAAGLYDEQERTDTITTTYPQITDDCGNVYPETVPADTTEDRIYKKIDEGEIKIEFCFSAVPCGGGSEEVFASGELTIGPGYNPDGFTQSMTLDWNTFLEYSCLRDLPLQLKSRDDTVYLRVYRIDNFTASTPVYFSGYSFTEGDAWYQDLADINAITPDKPVIPDPAIPSVNILDDGVGPQVVANGSPYVANFCFETTPDTPTITIDNVTVSEGDGTAVVTVSLDPVANQTVTVAYTTRDDTAVAGSDYTATSGTLTFLPGQGSKTISIPILADSSEEFTEEFFVDLSNLTGDAVFGDQTGSVTITDDDAVDPGSSTCTVKVSANDTTCNYLQNKISSGSGISLSVSNEGGDERLVISADGLGISRPDGCPSLSVASPAVKNYTAGNTSLFPLFTTGSTANDNNVTFTIQITTGLGAVSSTVSVAGTTKTWTEGDKTFIIDGPYPDVNQVLTGLTYTASANDTGEVKYTAKVTDANGKEKGTCGEQLKFVTNEVFIEYKGACSGELTLSGTNGSISINTRKEDGTFLRNIANQSFQTSLQTTVENIVNEINTVNTTPNFTAQVTGTHKFKVCAAKGLGETANGWYVNANITGGDFVVSGDTSMDGGVTGKIDRPSGGLGDDNFDVLDLIGDFADKVLDDILNPDESQIRIDIPQTEEPVQDIRYRFRGRNTVRIPNNFDPVNRTFSGNWDYVTFNTAYTNDPAWCLLDFMSNINYGCGNELYNRMSSAQQQQLHQDLYTISQRNNETIHGGPRYTVNAVITNKMTKYDVLQAIAGCMHSKVLFLGSNVVRVIQDAPKEPVMLVNQTSMSVEGAAYSEKAASSVYNVGVVSYYDPSQYSKLTAKEVRLDDVYDVVPNDQIKNIVAWGVNNEAQAVRHMRKVLYDEAIDGVSIKYQAGIDTRNLIPGDVIRVLDIYNETSSNAYSGRVVSSADSTHITLDRDFTLSSTPEVFITMPDGSIHSTTIIGVADREVTLADAMPLTPEPYAKFNITTGKDYIVTKTHRNAKGVYEVFGVNYDSNKYTTIDGDL